MEKNKIYFRITLPHQLIIGKMKYILVFILLFSFITKESYAQQNTGRFDNFLTLEDIWKNIEKNNKNIKVELLEIKRREQIIHSAIADYFPDISLNANYDRNTKMPVYENELFSTPDYFPIGKYGYGVGYELSLDLYDGGKKYRNTKLRKEEKNLVVHQCEATKNNIKLIAAVTYYDLFRNLQFRDLVQQEILADKLQLKTIENFYNNGVVLKSDLLRASVKLSDIELSLSEINNNIQLDIQQLNILMGRDENNSIEINYHELFSFGDLNCSGYEELTNIALKENFICKMALDRLNISKLNIRQSKANILPKIAFFSYYNIKYPQVFLYPYSSNQYGFGQFGIKISFPIDAFYKNSYKVTANKLAYKQERINRNIVEDKLSIKIREIYLQLQYSKESIETANKNIVRVTETVRVLKNAYYNQQLTLTDLLDAETDLLDAKFKLMTSKINLQIEYLKLREAMGVL
ncbi:MAG: hypothetical protein PARBA_03373 [Parabacteroides sp.]